MEGYANTHHEFWGSTRGRWPTKRNRRSRIEFLPSILRSSTGGWFHGSGHLRICSARQFFWQRPREISTREPNPHKKAGASAHRTPRRLRVAAPFFAGHHSSRRIWHLREPHQFLGKRLIIG